MDFDREQLDAQWQRAFDYVESRVGGRIVGAERQARWRPAWFLEVEREGGERASIYLRGARGESDHGVYPLRHEFDCMQILERHGVPVPHLYGFCPDPECIVMDRVPGRYYLAAADSEEEQRSVMDHYMELLAGMHRLPLEEFEAVGLTRPASDEALALGDFDPWVAGYRKTKKRPEPMLEFVIDWIRRNTPGGRERVAFLAGDSGQFLFDRGRVSAIIDLELAYLGDPVADLAAMLSRDLEEPLGDLNYALSRYEAHSGEPVDRDALAYHTVRFGIYAPLGIAASVAAPGADADLVRYLGWYLVCSRCTLEVIARLRGIEIAPAELPAGVDTAYSAAHGVLRDRLSRLATPEEGDEFGAYRLDEVQRLATYLERADRFGPEVEAADLDEAAVLLGRRPATIAECDAALEELVSRQSGDLDEPLVRYFVRRTQRAELLLEPVLGQIAGAHIQTPSPG